MPKTLRSGKLQQNKSKEPEVFGLVNDLHDFASQYFRGGPFLLSTATAGASTIWTNLDEMPEGALWAVTAHVQGQAAAAQCNLVGQALFFRKMGGVATQEGATASLVTIRTDVNFTRAFALVGNVLTLTVTDASGRAVNWSAWIEIRQSA